jgi:hypothetical protein
LRHQVCRTAQRNGLVATGSSIGHTAFFREDQRQRTGPKRRHQVHGKFRDILRKQSHLRRIDHMHDERVICGSAFGLKNSAHSLRVQSISCQAIDRFRGQTNQAAL